MATVNDTQYTVGSLASAMSGPAMAVAIGYALHCPPLVLFSLITVGFASNALGGAGGPLAVLFVAIFASEIGKAVSKETKIDIQMCIRDSHYTDQFSFPSTQVPVSAYLSEIHPSAHESSQPEMCIRDRLMTVSKN